MAAGVTKGLATRRPSATTPWTMRTSALRHKLICESVPEKALFSQPRRGEYAVWPAGLGLPRLLSLYRKNYVARGIVFMLHNYATRDQRIGGVRLVGRSRGSYEGGGLVSEEEPARGGAGARRRERVGTEEEKNRLVEEKFFGGWFDRPTDRPTTRLMNRNNSRAIVLFGSFQLTVARPLSFPVKLLRHSPQRPAANTVPRMDEL